METPPNNQESLKVVIDELKGAEKEVALTIRGMVEHWRKKAADLYPNDTEEQEIMVRESAECYCSYTADEYTLTSETTIIDYDRKMAITETLLTE